MRWPWRRRRGGRVVFIGQSPYDVAAVIASVPTPSPVVSAWVPDPAPPGDDPEPAAHAVELGFADGSTMTLDADDPRAVALLAAAARLTGSTP
jgi:hypothetical protein